VIQEIKEYDRIGRAQLHKIGFPTFFASIPGLMARTRVVPARAIAEQREDETLIDCPCGHHPVVTDVLRPCTGDCERYYVAYDDHAFVVYGGLTPPDGARAAQA
jgi:hypothetical protein